MRVREVSDDDGQRIADLMASVLAEYPGFAFEPNEYPELEHVAQSFARVSGRMWVVEAAGEVVACVGVRPSTRSDFELVKLFVERSHRRRGLGTRLIALAEAEAKARGGKRMVLFSDTRFVDAHRLYERLHYRRTGEVVELDDASSSREYGFCKRLT